MRSGSGSAGRGVFSLALQLGALTRLLMVCGLAVYGSQGQ